MADKDLKPWEGEKAPADPDANKPEPTDDNAAQDALTVDTSAEPEKPAKPAAKKDTAKVKHAKLAMGVQAPLSLINLVSSGMSMKDAKKKLGIK